MKKICLEIREIDKLGIEIKRIVVPSKTNTRVMFHIYEYRDYPYETGKEKHVAFYVDEKELLLNNLGKFLKCMFVKFRKAFESYEKIM